MYATADTIGLIGDELAILADQQVDKQPDVRIGSGNMEDGQCLSVTSTERFGPDYSNSLVTIKGHYSPNLKDRILLEQIPRFRAVTEERVDPSYELSLPKAPNKKNDLVDTYWVYDRPVGVASTTDFEPVIYKMPTTITDTNKKYPGDSGLDRQEFELAQQSGNLHRLSETEAKDFLKQIQSVEVLHTDDSQ